MRGLERPEESCIILESTPLEPTLLDTNIHFSESTAVNLAYSLPLQKMP
jgi:hypothetical protein